MTVQWTCKTFDALSSRELYAALRLRNEVFVVEQACIFQDADDKDEASLHLAGTRDGVLAAYARLVPAGVSYDEVSIGRVVVAKSARKLGLGRALMERALMETYARNGSVPVRLGAQLYLQRFYESLGFSRVGDVYDEDGIDHVLMWKPAP